MTTKTWRGIQVSRQQGQQKFKDIAVKLENIECVLQQHHWECIFEVDAPKQIQNRIAQLDVTLPEKEFAEEFRKCYILSEIFCPHENIDRRSEYGIV